MRDHQHPLTFIIDEARTRNVNVIPVTGTDRDADYNVAVRNAILQDGLGLALRIKEHDFGDLQTNIDSIIGSLKVLPDQVDLIVDYNYVDPQSKIRTTLFLNGLINSLPYLQGWRNIILSGTSFPENLSSVSADTVDQIERTEWLIWKKLLSNNIGRRLIFSDYGIANPQPFDGDPRFINMSANIRYTASDKFIIFKGKATRKAGSSQYHQLATQVVNHAEYSGPNFSAGDHYIHQVSNKEDGPGNATKWRMTGTNHHLTYVTNELSSFSLT